MRPYQVLGPYQAPFPKDFNTEVLFHVSVSVKRIFIFVSLLNEHQIIYS